ncbi:MAG: nitrile hydratase accessory protein [Methylorubrum populi]
MAAAPDYVAMSLPPEGPTFEQPWQAHAFSLTVQLHEAGLFTWPAWVEVFGDEIKRSPARPGESASDAYHRQWLQALQTIVVSNGIVETRDVSDRIDEWRRAYLNTPHGQPVMLANASCAAHDHHHHAPARQPITVSAATHG